jgi:nucleoside-diphosphate-sugar epimerase
VSSGARSDDTSVLILGCGYTGVVLAQALTFAGRPVIGTTRSDVRASVIRSRGAQPLMFDAGNLSALDRIRGRVEAVISCVPPQRREDGTFEDHHEAIMARLAGPNLRAFVYVSSTSVYGDHGGALVNEETPCTPDSPRGEARLRVEQTVLHSGLPAMVVRPSGIYGPGRSQLHRIASGRYRLVGEGEAITNRIHVQDLSTILRAAIDRGEPGRVYLASDSEPVSQRDVVDWVLDRWSLPTPSQMSLQEAKIRLGPDVFRMITGSKRLDASKTLASLGVRLRHPNYRHGLEAIWRREAPAIRELIAS